MEGCSWRSGAGLDANSSNEITKVTTLWKSTVQVDSKGLVLSPAPSSLDIGLEACKLFSNLASLQRQEGRESAAQQKPEKPSQVGRPGRAAIYSQDTPDLSPHNGADSQSLAASFPFKTRNGSITHHPGHLSWSGDINLTVCHFPFGLGPLEAALQTPSIKCS